MSEPLPATPPRALSITLGLLAAFASFALVGLLLQGFFGGKTEESREDRLQKKADVAAAQDALLAKYGLKDNADAIFAKAAAQIQTRKPSATTVVVPGTPTALKIAAAAPPPAAAPAKPAAAPAPAAPASGAPPAPAK